MNRDGPLISWRSRKQSTTALSTCEAEYLALFNAVQEAKFIKQLYKDMKGDELEIDIYADNQSANKLAKNPINHQRSKHIDVKYHYIRSEIQNNNVNLNYIPSKDNIADMFTKPLSKIKLREFIKPILN